MGSDLRGPLDAGVAALLAGRQMVAIRHPLGFVCLPLMRGVRSGVCLHVWTSLVPRADLTTSPVHCHSWDLESRVLYGVVRNERVLVSETAEQPTHRLFDVHSRGDVDEIRATDTLVRCERVEPQLSGPGDVYQLPAGHFHNTVVPGQEAATLVVGTNRPGGQDRSIGPIQVSTHVVRRQYCDTNDGALAVRAVTQHLLAAGAPRLAQRLEEVHEATA